MAPPIVLYNPLADPGSPTPSSKDGVPAELERELRFFGGLLIQQSGILLKLPQVVMSTAATLFQRFFFVTSFKHFGVRDVAAGALFLASKLEEEPARLRDIINVFDYLLSLVAWTRSRSSSASAIKAKRVQEAEQDAVGEQEKKIMDNPLLPEEIKVNLVRNLRDKGVILPANGAGTGDKGKARADYPDDGDDDARQEDRRKAGPVKVDDFRYEPMDLFAQRFYDRKEEMVVAEMQILKRLGFHVQVQQPYSAMVNYLRILELTQHPTIPQRAWNYLNDSLLTSLPALYPSTHLATLSIRLASRDASLSLPPTWWILFDVEDSAELDEMEALLIQVYPSEGADLDETVWERVSGLPETKEGVRRRAEGR